MLADVVQKVRQILRLGVRQQDPPGGGQDGVHRQKAEPGAEALQGPLRFIVSPGGLQGVQDLQIAPEIVVSHNGAGPQQIAVEAVRELDDALGPEQGLGGGAEVLVPDPAREAEGAVGKESASPEPEAGAGGVQQQLGLLRQADGLPADGGEPGLPGPLPRLRDVAEVEDIHLGMALRHAGGEAFQGLGLYGVVAVHKEQVVPPGGLDAGVPGGP